MLTRQSKDTLNCHYDLDSPEYLRDFLWIDLLDCICSQWGYVPNGRVRCFSQGHESV